ncbi:hypothetical protein B0H19DRAFT_1112269 [Mycena capillaripes]|nr:hypothetical protein B0H19DRAFT_1112269 [Mycena capillaripes]
MVEVWLPVISIPALRSAVLGEPPVKEDNDTGTADLLSGKLAQIAKQTIWDNLPFRAIAEAHKREAEALVARGSLETDSTTNNAAVCIEYYKYLQLYPHKEDTEYKYIFSRVHVLERAMDSTTSAVDLPVPSNSGCHSLGSTSPADHLVDSEPHFSSKWSFFFLGIITATIVPFVVRRISATR